MLEARDLAIGYRRRVVGRGFNIELGPGEVLALLGPNGGGKTTLLKTLLGLLPPLAGTVRLAGQDLGRLLVRDRARHLAYVPQVHSGIFAFTIEDMVLMGRSAWTSLLSPPSAHDREVTREALSRLGIVHLAGRPYTQISGGERQLALIARALAQEPRIVLLDEPTASLDFGNQGAIMREIRRLADTGLAVAFSTHDPNHALRYADRALLIRAGAFTAAGPVRDVLTRERLEALYRADVIEVGHSPDAAYLPG